ncbi:MAG: hypothetical protein J6Y02_11905, partial [Pseudobutyrivibrio sp.]|nr:hypothetical protein [Pseudobutyrivibrio sp.]
RRAQSILKPILGLVLIDIFVGIYFSLIGNVEDNFKWVFVWSIILFTIRYYCRYALFVNIYKKIAAIYIRISGGSGGKITKLANRKLRYLIVSGAFYISVILLPASFKFMFILIICGIHRMIIETNFIINLMKVAKIYGPLKNVWDSEYMDPDDYEMYYRIHCDRFGCHPEFTVRQKIAIFIHKRVKSKYAFLGLVCVVLLLVAGRFHYSRKEVTSPISAGYELYYVSNDLPLWTGLDNNIYGIRNNSTRYDSGLIYNRPLEFDSTGIAWYEDRFVDYKGNTIIQLDSDIYSKETPNRGKLIPTYFAIFKEYLVGNDNAKRNNVSSIKILVGRPTEDDHDEDAVETEPLPKLKLYVNSHFLKDDEGNYFVGGYAEFYSSYLNGFGCVQDTGKTMIYPEYKYINSSSSYGKDYGYESDNPYEYTKNASAVDKYGKQSIIDMGTGKVIISGLDNIYIQDKGFSARSDDFRDMISVYNRKEEKYKYYDSCGKEVVFKDTDFIDSMGDRVKNNTTIRGNEFYTMLALNDDEGKPVVFLRWELGDYEYDDLYYLYDTDGNILVEESFCRLKFNKLGEGQYSYSAITKDCKPVLIDMDGNMTVFDYYAEKLFRDDDHNVIFKVRNNSDDDGEPFYIDAYGNIIEPNLSE